MKYTKTINLDVNKPFYEVLHAKQNDNARYLLFNLMNNGVPFALTDKTVRAYAVKPDNTKVYNDLTIINAINGQAELQLTSQMLAVPGMISVELVIFEGTDILSTVKFVIEVTGNLRNDAAIESTNEFSALVNALASIDNLEVNYAPRLNVVESSLSDITNQVVETKQVHNVKKPIISFSYDGTYSSVYDVLNPIFSNRGVSATLGIETIQIGQSNRMTEQQILELQNIYGHEIASHSITHPYLSDISVEECEYELLQSKRILEGFGCKVNHHIYPFGCYNENVINITKKHYESASVTLGGETSYYNNAPINTYKLTRVGMSDSGGNQTLEYYKNMVDSAISNNSWLIFYSHGTEYEGDVNEQQILSDLIDYIKSVNVEIMTIQKAHDFYKNKIDIGYRGSNRFKPNTSGAFDYVGAYYMIGYEGTIEYGPMDAYSDNSLYVLFPKDSFDSTVQYTSYPREKIVTFEVSTSMATGFPGNSGGILTTYRISTSVYLCRQEYRRVATSELWVRYVGNDNLWTAWLQYATVSSTPAVPGTVIALANAYTSATLITDYPAEKVTIFRTNSTNTVGFPESSYGIVTTYSIGGNGWSRQEFRKYMSNDIWNRYVDATGAWTTWVKSTV